MVWHSYAFRNVKNDPEGNEPENSRTIILSEREVRAAARILKLLAEPVDPVSVALEGVSRFHGERGKLIRIARAAFADRQRRPGIFGDFMFGEPAWDMLLILYITESSDARTTISNLASHSGAPSSTAQRWIELLIDKGLAIRHAHPTDRRTFFIRLSDKGRAAMDLYFSGTCASDL